VDKQFNGSFLTCCVFWKVEFRLENNIKPQSLDLCEIKISSWNKLVSINVVSDINGTESAVFLYNICSPQTILWNVIKTWSYLVPNAL
jgi:hypothetical protein